MPKGLGSRYWEEIMLALIGQQFTIHGNLKNETEEICGAVISIRYNEDILGIWNRNAAPSNHVEIEKIRVAVQKILQLPTQAHMEYKPHETSLQDRTGTSASKNLGSTKTSDASVSTTTATTSTSTNSNHHSNNSNHHHHHSHSTSTSSRRSGSWTERDKTASSNSNAVGVKHHHHKDGNAAPRGSWRN
jgi:translation initiation factor 4E